jgi:hypothetical protein
MHSLGVGPGKPTTLGSGKLVVSGLVAVAVKTSLDVAPASLDALGAAAPTRRTGSKATRLSRRIMLVVRTTIAQLCRFHIYPSLRIIYDQNYHQVFFGRGVDLTKCCMYANDGLALQFSGRRTSHIPDSRLAWPNPCTGRHCRH